MYAWSRTNHNVGLVEIKWNWAISLQKTSFLLFCTTVGNISQVKPFTIQMSIKMLSLCTLIFRFYFLFRAKILILEDDFLEKNNWFQGKAKENALLQRLQHNASCHDNVRMSIDSRLYNAPKDETILLNDVY